MEERHRRERPGRCCRRRLSIELVEGRRTRRRRVRVLGDLVAHEELKREHPEEGLDFRVQGVGFRRMQNSIASTRKKACMGRSASMSVGISIEQ
jgi:hypothetical protein